MALIEPYPLEEEFYANEILDYKIAYLSRQMSLIGRKEVLSGRAKFGAFGGGKEVAQVAVARVARPGDFRAGYYRDQTFGLASGYLTAQAFFAQLYGHRDVTAEPASAGRQMVSHFASRLLDEHGEWLPQTTQINTSSDISPTSGQMPRLVGLAYASTLYRHLPELHHMTRFSKQGNEVAFGMIGNASTAEGHFWEAINAIGILQSPAVISIWDDEYGISVPNEFQFIKSDLSAMLQGFERDGERGFNLYQVKAWDYPQLLAAYQDATEQARRSHIPAIVHVVEVMQPQGHSTSGSHERYKSAERLAWEASVDPIDRMRAWLLSEGVIAPKELERVESDVRSTAEAARDAAYEAFFESYQAPLQDLRQMLDTLGQSSAEVRQLGQELDNERLPQWKKQLQLAQKALIATRTTRNGTRSALQSWAQQQIETHRFGYGSHMTSRSAESPLHVSEIPAVYGDNPVQLPGFQILQQNFDAILGRDPRVSIFGEDVGFLGDVNQGVAGLQDKYGPLRVADTGIREATIVGQAIGMALRGLRPIAEIQYLDYLLYGITALSDDLATTHWRTAGGQKAPAIIRTRGHRLEGVWHSGSPIGTLINSLRGIHLLVPRNMTQAAGFYNTLLQGDDPAIVIEVLNAYRVREPLPDNLTEMTIPLGVPEIMRSGTDMTLVTYGATCAIAASAAEVLDTLDISVELIDVRTLLPFDLKHRIAESVAKTGRLVVLDEDMPGGASAYMLQQILETQGAYWSLDSEPRTITAQPHRPPHTTDGDYFSKPNAEEVVRVVYDLMHEADPARYPEVF